MTEEEIKEVLKDNTPQQSETSLLAMKQYDIMTHNVMNPSVRKDKTVYKPVLDHNGDPMKDTKGKPITQTILEPVNRVPIPMQKTIVALRKYFMNLKGAVLTTDNDQSELLDEVNRVRKLNKYSFKIEDVATRTMSELSSAEMWWINKKNEIKMRVISPSSGDILLPIFDEYGDLTLFLRQYVVKDEKLIDAFTNDFKYTFDSNYNVIEFVKQGWGKIPIVYYSQPKPEWIDVQPKIERYETLTSNLADTNDYSGAPITVISGEVLGFANKGDQGKTIMLEKDANISYLTADSSPESMSLELNNLYRDMFLMSHTPDISIEALKGQGTSGVAFDRLFTDANLSAEAKLSGTFGESLQRSVNLVSSMVRFLNKSLPDDIIEVETEAYRFNDISDYIKDMVLLSGILSDETRTKLIAGKYGLIEAQEWERVNTEKGRQSVEDLVN